MDGVVRLDAGDGELGGEGLDLGPELGDVGVVLRNRGPVSELGAALKY